MSWPYFLRAAAVVSRANGDAVAGPGKFDPKIVGPRMANRIGDDLLDAPQHRVCPRGIIDRQIFRNHQMNLRRSDACDECSQSLSESNGIFAAQRTHNASQIGKQQFRYRLCSLNLDQRIVPSEMACGFQVQAEGRQVVSERVVQFAGDAFALSQAAGIGQQLARCPQFVVGSCKSGASAGFACSEKATEERENLEAYIG